MKRRKRYWYVLISVIILTALIFGGRALFLHVVKKRIASKIESLNQEGYAIRYDTLIINWKTNTISLENLSVSENSYDTTCVRPEYFSARKLLVDDVKILSFIFTRELDIDYVELVEPRVYIRSGTSKKEKASSKKKGEGGIPLRIDRFVAKKVLIQYTDSAQCKLLRSMDGDIDLRGLVVDMRDTASYDWSVEGVAFNQFNLHQPDALYDYQITKAEYNSGAKTLEFDSIRIKPNLNKIEFGQKVGHDLDRMEGVVPYIRATDFSWNLRDSLELNAAFIETQFFLKIFRDKRLPHKEVYKPLPLDALKQAGFVISIDSMKIIKSYVAYEEILPGSSEAGKVEFDDLYASIYDIRNEAGLENVTRMEATAQFMSQGQLYVKAAFPSDRKVPNTLRGSLRNFELKGVNSMLEPNANVKIESGRMNEVSFSFSYTETVSKGEVEMNYQDLKLVSLRDEEDIEKAKSRKRNRNKSEEELSKAPIKTMLVNALIRDDMDEKVPEDKRTGKIEFYRLKDRSIFNYWWKSVFSGLKDAFGLDRLQGKSK